MKVDIEEVESVLYSNKVEPEKAIKILSDLNKVVEELKEEKIAAVENSGGKPKWESVIVLLDKNNELKDREFAGWVVQIEEGKDPATIMSGITDACKVQNETAKRKKSFLTTVIEAFEGLKPKFLKEKRIKIKTKELTRIIITDNKLV
jgi:hypothetical protein